MKRDLQEKAVAKALRRLSPRLIRAQAGYHQSSSGFKTAQSVGVLSQIGFLHGYNTPQALVYDFMEPFRHGVVDAGRCFPLSLIIRKEAVALRKAIETENVWQPWKFPWRHQVLCK